MGPVKPKKIKPLALQSKVKSGRTCNLGATEGPEKSLLRNHHPAY
jgi:hypothetical protein